MTRYIGKMVAGVLLVTVMLLQPAMAGGTQKLEWTDLVPGLPPLKNPLVGLSDSQREAFDNISYFQSFGAASSLNRADLVDYREAKRIARKSRRELEKKKIDVKGFFDHYNKWEKEVERRKGLTAKKYNGKKVSLAGYLLPLDFSRKGVRDFLLVPYVGACVHSPSPPLNQIVYVRMGRRYKVKGLFDPVRVTGRMSTKRVSKKLSLVDGSNVVNAGYSLAGKSIKRYKKNR